MIVLIKTEILLLVISSLVVIPNEQKG